MGVVEVFSSGLQGHRRISGKQFLTAMHAENPLVDGCSERKPFEEFVDALPHFKTLCQPPHTLLAFLPEAKPNIDIGILRAYGDPCLSFRKVNQQDSG